MLSEELRHIGYFLNGLADQVDEEAWHKIRAARNNIFGLADRLQGLEENIEVPAGPIAQAKQQLQEVTHG